MPPLKFLALVIAFISFFLIRCNQNYGISIHYLVLTEQLSAEHQAAMNFIQRSPSLQPQLLLLSASSFRVIPKGIVWLHIPDSSEYEKWIKHKNELKGLMDFYKQGGKLLLSNYAACLPYELGIESEKPEIKILNIQDDWLFDKKGLQSYRGHPAFHELFGGTFIWDAYENHSLPTIGYFDQRFPAAGKVVAVEKSYITIHSKNKLMVEYQENDGKILSVGGFIYLSRPNHLHLHLEKFLDNCLNYLVGHSNSEPVTFWNKYENKPRQFSVTSGPLHPPVCRELQIPPLDDMVLQRDHTSQNYYDVSGQRALVMGKEAGGIDELWIHPFRLLRDFEAGIIQYDSVAWLKKIPAKIEVRPESFCRIYQLPAGSLIEIILPALYLPGVVVHYYWTGSNALQLVIKYRSDLRWMWPYDENAIGDVTYAYDTELQALHVRDSQGDLYGFLGADIKPQTTMTGQFADLLWKGEEFQGIPTDLNQVYHASLYQLDQQNNFCLNFGMVGTNTGQIEAARDYHKLLLHLQGIYDEARNYYKNLLAEMVTIQTPDEEFNTLWKWAIIGTEKFLAYTPGLGTALLAGFSTTARGWRGGHKISGRPGYAWYFGRDSEWSGFAIDDYGHFEIVKTQLDFLQKYQDLSGKIFHEISTSGVVHFDAADATPLYVILAAHYLRASADITYVQESWQYIQKAMNYLYSTDTDGDLLIENTNEGHGWVEGGELFGAHTTFYLASLWAQTLKDASYLAAHVKLPELQKKYYSDYLKVHDILNSEFWNDSTHFYNYGKLKDGSFNPEATVLPAVPMYFRLLDHAKVQNMLDQYAGNGFSPDWGIRIVSSESRYFVPTGYHYGSVWPLFTGWASLAEFNYGKSVQGFTHMMNNLLIKNNWTLGYVEEVMNGAAYKPAGVCPHQCWSETNILHPGIHGMIGWQPDAPELKTILAPRFPLHWDSIEVKNLRIGNSLINMVLERGVNYSRYCFSLEKGSPVLICFAPEFPAGMEMLKVVIDGQQFWNRSENLANHSIDTLRFQLTGQKEIQFEHHSGIGVIPFISHPLPEDSSSGYRIIRQVLNDQQFILEVEGKSHTAADFELYIYDQKVSLIENAEILSMDEKGQLKIRVYFPKSKERYIGVTIKISLTTKG